MAHACHCYEQMINQSILDNQITVLLQIITNYSITKQYFIITNTTNVFNEWSSYSHYVGLTVPGMMPVLRRESFIHWTR